MIVLIKTVAAVFFLVVHVLLDYWFPLETVLGKLPCLKYYLYTEIPVISALNYVANTANKIVDFCFYTFL